MWMDYDAVTAVTAVTVGGRRIVTKLKCKVCTRYVDKLQCCKNTVCTRFVDKLQGCKHFSMKWIEGAQSPRTSNVRDHAQSDQHARAMSLLKKEQAVSAGEGPSSYSTIARSLNRLDSQEKERLRKKFDISYFVATEK